MPNMYRHNCATTLTSEEIQEKIYEGLKELQNKMTNIPGWPINNVAYYIGIEDTYTVRKEFNKMFRAGILGKANTNSRRVGHSHVLWYIPSVQPEIRAHENYKDFTFEFHG